MLKSNFSHAPKVGLGVPKSLKKQRYFLEDQKLRQVAPRDAQKLKKVEKKEKLTQI